MKEVFATFSGQINEDSTQRIFKAFANATVNQVTHLHLLLESYGGYVGDGVALYNFFKSFPIGLTIYNTGTIQSMAVIAYLGATKRKVSASAAFMIHRSVLVQLPANAAGFEAIAKSKSIDDSRTESILREHLKLTSDEWKLLNYMDLHFSAEEAIKNGLAQDIGEFSPPPGALLYNI